jgi:hypothetical protein
MVTVAQRVPKPAFRDNDVMLAIYSPKGRPLLLYTLSIAIFLAIHCVQRIVAVVVDARVLCVVRCCFAFLSLE